MLMCTNRHLICRTCQMPINDRTADRWSLGVGRPQAWRLRRPASRLRGLTSPTHRGLGTDAVDGKSRSPALAQIWTWPTLSAWCSPVFSKYLLLRFPSELCTDGARAINNPPNPDWPSTLQGEAMELDARWRDQLSPRGFHLAARLLDFPDGKPGDVGLFLFWGE